MLTGLFRILFGFFSFFWGEGEGHQVHRPKVDAHTDKFSIRKSNDVIKDGVERELTREINTLGELLDKAYLTKAELLRLKVEAGTEANELGEWSDDTDGVAEGYEAIVKAMRKRLHEVQEEAREAQFRREMENEQKLLEAETR